MTALGFLAAIGAFAMFALSTDAHALARLHVRPTGHVRRRRRAAAWVLVAVAFAAIVAGRGWVYGPILWVGAIMAAAAIVFLSLNFLPAAPGTARGKQRSGVLAGSGPASPPADRDRGYDRRRGVDPRPGPADRTG